MTAILREVAKYLAVSFFALLLLLVTAYANRSVYSKVEVDSKFSQVEKRQNEQYKSLRDDLLYIRQRIDTMADKTDG
jgi:hypothetical protein